MLRGNLDAVKQKAVTKLQIIDQNVIIGRVSSKYVILVFEIRRFDPNREK